MANTVLKKRMRIMLICMAILIGSIFIYKGIKAVIFYEHMKHMNNDITVTTTTAHSSTWPNTQESVASLRSIRGVDVTTELAGMVQAIYFKSGKMIKAGDVLVQLNADSDVATLHSLQASTALANVTVIRDFAQFKIHAISQATLDADTANLKSLQAKTAAQAATVYKKTILAPFTGRLGISKVNLGQYLNPADKIVTLQQLDPIYADFYIPQQNLSKLQQGQKVSIEVDAFPQHEFNGEITAINPTVDTETRNIEVEATIENQQHKLLPGMFTSVKINLGRNKKFITLPVTSVTFNTYGSIVYLVDKNNIAKQVFVTTGDQIGDQIAILTGLNEGDVVVTSGQIKLKNGSKVIIDNTNKPDDSRTPAIPNER